VGIVIGGIDPGFTTGGLVVLEEPNLVIYGRSLAPKRGDVAVARAIADKLHGDREFNRGDILARAQAQRFLTALDESPKRPDFIAVESFVDQPQHAKTMRKGLWKTPLMMGYLAAGLVERGYSQEDGTLQFQNAGVVLKHFSLRLGLIQRGDHATVQSVYPGSGILTNNHMRSAFAHAAWCALRLPRKEM
jgi:hypothetical protein